MLSMHRERVGVAQAFPSGIRDAVISVPGGNERAEKAEIEAEVAVPGAGPRAAFLTATCAFERGDERGP